MGSANAVPELPGTPERAVAASGAWTADETYAEIQRRLQAAEADPDRGTRRTALTRFETVKSRPYFCYAGGGRGTIAMIRSAIVTRSLIFYVVIGGCDAPVDGSMAAGRGSVGGDLGGRGGVAPSTAGVTGGRGGVPGGAGGVAGGGSAGRVVDGGTSSSAPDSRGDGPAADSAITAPPPAPPPVGGLAAYDLVGFAQAATGGGALADTGPNYRKVTNADELVAALASKTVKVIELMNDLNLGWNEIPASARQGAIRSESTPLLHPVLKRTGVSVVDVQNHDGLTIFSASGVTIRHAHLNVKKCSNVIIRNIKFDELWEWDEASRGDYDKQGWDFITVDMACKTVWIDHCEFTKAYDGVLDIKGGSADVTVSWSKFSGDDGGPSSFVRQQIDELEKTPSAYPMYGFLRSNGFSVDDIVAISRSQKKGHLVGANDLDAKNAAHTVTLHHNWYNNMQDRIPRLRAGNVHAYNLYVSNTDAATARKRRDQVVAAMTATSAARLQGNSPTYHFGVTLNGAISTEGGAVLIEKSVLIDVASPIRNNQVSAAQAIYTGKIKAADVIHLIDAKMFRGGSDDAGSPLAPVPAPALAFSWNGFAVLPYRYAVEDPTVLQARLTGGAGAGAGKLAWDKKNWLKTSY